MNDLIDALSRLNTHARAGGAGKKAIYAYKTFVACALAEDARPVRVQARCIHCRGTMIYRDWDGYERGACYRCTKGVVTLQFIESTIGACRWHHPMKDGGGDVLRSVWDVSNTRWEGDYTRQIAILHDGTEREIIYAQVEDWGPNMPGAEKLPPDEACRLLNIVEAAVPEISPGARSINARWARERAMREMNRYQIRLERIEEGCCICGTADTYCGCSNLSWGFGFVDFSRLMCSTCHLSGTTRHTLSRGVSAPYRWPTEPHPESLTPNVVAWLAHPWRQRQRAMERE